MVWFNFFPTVSFDIGSPLQMDSKLQIAKLLLYFIKSMQKWLEVDHFEVKNQQMWRT